MGHAILPPSSADKWMVCRGWYQAVKDLPPLPSSKYAEEGTIAHEVLEASLRFGLEPEDCTADVDMAEAVGYMYDWLKQYLVQNPGSEWYPEQRLSWGALFRLPFLTGTSDLCIVNSEELVINDYKHGKGMMVEVEDNNQLRIYLLGALQKYGEREQYRLVVSQPRAQHQDGPVRETTISKMELRTFMNEVEHAVKENLSLKGKRKAGEHCRHWCPAAATCREYAEHNLSMAIEEFGEFE